MNSKTEYRNWALIALDYFLQKVEHNGAGGDAAEEATKSYFGARLAEELSPEECGQALDILHRIARLLPADDVFSSVSWNDEDIRNALERADVTPTPKKVKIIKEKTYWGSWLNDMMIETGWDILGQCVDEYIREQVNAGKEP